MRVKYTFRLLLLGGLIIVGTVAYQRQDMPAKGDPATVTSLVPSPVTMSVLTARPS